MRGAFGLAFCVCLASILSSVTADEGKPELGPPSQQVFALLAEAQVPQDLQTLSHLCEGDGCDAYVSILHTPVKFEDIGARQKRGSALGALAGALIGGEAIGSPGAVLGAVVGAVEGRSYIDSARWEKTAQTYQQAWQRGDDTYYNPAHGLPLKAHWMFAGPSKAGVGHNEK